MDKTIHIGDAGAITVTDVKSFPNEKLSYNTDEIIDVNIEEVDGYVTWMFMQDKLPGDYRKLTDIPTVTILRERLILMEGMTVIDFPIAKLKYNVRGRAKKMYVEWPLVISLPPWILSYLFKWNLIDIKDDEDFAEVYLITFKSDGDFFADYRRLEKDSQVFKSIKKDIRWGRDTEDIWVLTRFKGTFPARKSKKEIYKLVREGLEKEFARLDSEEILSNDGEQ